MRLFNFHIIFSFCLGIILTNNNLHAQGTISKLYFETINTSSGSFDETCNGPSSTIQITLPPGENISVTGIDYNYNFISVPPNAPNTQQSYLYLKNTEQGDAIQGNSNGTQGATETYTGSTNFANQTFAGGSILTFEIRAWRTFGANTGCNNLDQYIQDYAIDLHYSAAFETPKVGINTTVPESVLDINGKIKLGNDNTPIQEGNIRYNSAERDFEGYNGFQWKSMTSSRSLSPNFTKADTATISSYNMGEVSEIPDSIAIIYDSGGPNGNYGNNEDYTLTLQNDFPTSAIAIEIKVETYDLFTGFYQGIIYLNGSNIYQPNFTTEYYTYYGIDSIDIRFTHDALFPQSGFKITATFLFSDTYEPLRIEESSNFWTSVPEKNAILGGSKDTSIISLDSIGFNSFQYGKNAYAPGSHAIALGKNAIARGSTSFATHNAIARGENSIAMGLNAKSIGINSNAFGHSTEAIGQYSTALGFNTTASGNYSTALGKSTIASGTNSFSSGQFSEASGEQSTALGGSTASQSYSTALGSSTASGNNSTSMGNSYSSAYRSTAMGSSTASGDYATAMGASTSSGNYSTAMGRSTNASGLNSTAIGELTTASGENSIAIGSHMSTNNKKGSMFLGDSRNPIGGNSNNYKNIYLDNELKVRFASYKFYTNSDLNNFIGYGVQLTTNANAWSSLSDKTKKENFELINGNSVLDKLVTIPLTSWNYKGLDPQIYRHYGIMAQDFYANFGQDSYGVIGCDTLVNPIDMLGVAYIAIQTLDKERRSLEEENTALKVRMKKMERFINEDIMHKFTALEAKIDAIESANIIETKTQMTQEIRQQEE